MLRRPDFRSKGLAPMNALFLATVGVVSFTPAPLVWDSKGHMEVAEVAWTVLGNDDAGKAVQKKIEKLLAEHPFPHDIGWQASPDADQLRDAFATAATWPDIIKHDAHHPNAPYHPFYKRFAEDFGRPSGEKARSFESALHAWHFYDVQITASAHDGGLVAAPMTKKPQAAKFPTQIGNAYQALDWTRSVLKDASAKPEMRAIALCWIAHLVGDLHQPLHCATLVTTDPNGDRGGNDFHVPTETSTQNLHAIWDDILDPHGKKDTVEAAASRVLAIDAASAVGSPETGVLDLDAAHWIERGAKLAASHVYTFNGQLLRADLDAADDVQALLKDYRTMARELAEKRARLGGERLAAILKEDLK